MNAVTLQTPLHCVSGLDEKKTAILRKDKHLHSCQDLLEFLPTRYDDRRSVTAIGEITPQMKDVQLIASVVGVYSSQTRRRPMLRATFRDQQGGRISVVWFHGIAWYRKMLRIGAFYLLYGELDFFQGTPQLVHPEIEPYQQQELAIYPRYSCSLSMRTQGLHSKRLSQYVQRVFDQLGEQNIPETLSDSILQELALLPRAQALYALHFPASMEQLQRACYRFKFEELFFLQLRACVHKQVRKTTKTGICFTQIDEKLQSFCRHHLPFSLTDAQKRVFQEIRSDTRHGYQMNRLLQGDVGSGKTIVAFLSALLAIDNGYQVLTICPTSILAQQHYRRFRQYSAPIGVRVGLLTSTSTTAQRREILEAARTNALPLLIGTHALLEPTVVIKKLGLVIVDEQHRFGVEQRAALQQKSQVPPHMLQMTATPIPRTLALTQYGELDVSTINEFPPGRKKIITAHRLNTLRDKIFAFVETQILAGRQAYVVFPLIEQSGETDWQNVDVGYKRICERFPPPHYTVALTHGQQTEEDKDQNMALFTEGKAQILVSTTVVEVGVDVPNANVMIIEDANRFGISQLHQLRGRVGRSSEQSYCILLTGPQLSDDARTRIHALCTDHDGFSLAQKDLQLRGPGDMEGIRQSGALKLKLANLFYPEDQAILLLARQYAEKITKQENGLHLPQYTPIRQALDEQRAGEDRNWVS